MTHRSLLAAFLILLVSALPAAGQQEIDDRARLSLEDIHASGMFFPRSFGGGRWAAEGPVITFIEQDPASGASHLVSYNLETDEQKVLIDGSRLFAEDVGRLIHIEDYEYSRDGSKVLIYTDSEQVWRLKTKGYYYLYDLEAGELTPISDRERGFQMFAKFDPGARRVAFVRERDLYVVDLASMAETQLTFDGSEGAIINGTTDWVYEEEFHLRDAWSWSPDGRHIAFLKLDESETRDFTMADLRGHYPELTTFRYPKAGEKNSEVKVGVIEMASSEIAFFDTETWHAGGDRYEYIARLGWTPVIDGRHRVWMIRLDRDQNDVDLLYGDPVDQTVTSVLSENQETWITIDTGFSGLDSGVLHYLDDGEHFIWTSDRDGHQHLYLYKNDGEFVSQVTSGPWSITDLDGVDEEEGVVYFTATVESPLERHLYRVPLALSGSGTVRGSAAGPDTAGGSAGGSGTDGGSTSGTVGASNDGSGTPTVRRGPITVPRIARITERSGTHDINMSADQRYYIDVFSNVGTPPVTTLNRVGGETIKVLEDNAALARRVAAYDLAEPEFLEVAGADGTPLNAYVIKPRDFDPSREYPLLMYVYGGPGSQTVRDSWGTGNFLRYYWHQYLANELGILVASVDNRGTGGRGKEFKSAVYRQLGVLEAEDQIAAAKHFASESYVDPARIGIWGWSYGGFLTLLGMLYDDGPETFKLGVSVAPVTDWRQYDTIYTERYMSTPQNNAAGYDRGSPVNYADRLRDEQELLLIHGDLDDNVHLQNTVHMVDALQAANRQFDLMVYPGHNHGIYGGMARLHLFTLATRFLEENL